MWKLYLTPVRHYGVNTDIDLSSHVSREGKKSPKVILLPYWVRLGTALLINKIINNISRCLNWTPPRSFLMDTETDLNWQEGTDK